MNKNLFWLIPAVLLATLAGVILALPAFVASNTHRASMEALASSITGRKVHIAGKLSLGLFPAPELSAAQVTIIGPDAETITARALTLDISLIALLHGQLRAENLTLEAPVIAFPWPLPGGPEAIAPPAWLAALHAQISNGEVSLGAAHFTGVDADVFTGASGAVTVSGTGNLGGQNVNLSLALGAVALTGLAPLSLDASSGNDSLHFSGTLNPRSEVAGALDLATPQISGNATVLADGAGISASAMRLSAGKANITGTGAFVFARPAISANLIVQNLDLGALPEGLPAIPVALRLSASNVSYAGLAIPALQAQLDAGPAGMVLHSMQLDLPAGATLTGAGSVSPAGAIAGRASLASPDLAGLLGAYGASAPPQFIAAALSATLAGNVSQLDLHGITGQLGTSSVTGNLVLNGEHAAGALDFGHLDLLPVLVWLGRTNTGGFSADGQITAAQASFGTVPLTHLLLDGTLGGGLNLRRISADMLGGIAAGSVSLDPAGNITAARGFIALPSAAPLAALLPAAWRPPAGLAAPRLNAAIFARAGNNALATLLVATLGDFSVTAAPFINVENETAAGAITLRHPDAIAAAKIFGLSRGLEWPGPGSISLRASFTASPSEIGLPDFVLSLGNLTASGRLLRDNGVISGDVEAGTLAIPPISPDVQIPAGLLSGAKGGIELKAGRVLYAGNTILLGVDGGITLAPGSAMLAITRANLAGGVLSGGVTANFNAAGAPALAATLVAENVEAAQLALPLAFPYTVPSGMLAGKVRLTATGFSPKIWAATLAGSATLTGVNGALAGFNLAGLASALSSKTPSADLRKALAGGSTAFTTLAVGASIAQGNATLTTASLAGPMGNAAASGSVDLFDQDVALRLALQPDVAPPITIKSSVLGPWGAPRQYPALRAALEWKPATKTP